MTLIYKTDFEVDDFAQIWANANVPGSYLTMLKMDRLSHDSIG